ncbi:MAG: hypothetical protein AAF204_02740 [Pseudomonadota bacterium]
MTIEVDLKELDDGSFGLFFEGHQVYADVPNINPLAEAFRKTLKDGLDRRLDFSGSLNQSSNDMAHQQPG